MGLFYHRKMKIVLPLILCFYLESAVESRVLHAVKLQQAIRAQYPEYESESDSDYDESYSNPDPKPDEMQMNHADVKAYSSYYEEAPSHESDPQKNEPRCKQNIQNGQIQKSNLLIKSIMAQKNHRFLKPGVKAVYSYYDSSQNDHDVSDPFWDSIYSSSAQITRPEEITPKLNYENILLLKSKQRIKPAIKAQKDGSGFKLYSNQPKFFGEQKTKFTVSTQPCVDLNEHLNRALGPIRRFQPENILMARNPLHHHRARTAIGKRKKRQIEPSSDPERESFEDNGESEYPQERDIEYDGQINYPDYPEDDNEIRPNEELAYENALRNAGFIREYAYD